MKCVMCGGEAVETGRRLRGQEIVGRTYECGRCGAKMDMGDAPQQSCQNCGVPSYMRRMTDCMKELAFEHEDGRLVCELWTARPGGR